MMLCLKAEGRRFDPAPDHILTALTWANERSLPSAVLCLSDPYGPLATLTHRTMSHADRTTQERQGPDLEVMPHGYSNHTVRSGAVVTKSYQART